MKIPKSIIEEDYEFWKKSIVEQAEVYLDYFLDYEVIDISRYQKSPEGYKRVFKENCKRILNLFKERYHEKDMVEMNNPHNIAYAIIYISSGVSHIGLTFTDLGTLAECHPKVKIIMDYILNTIDALDWFKRTMEYKEWLEHEEWKKNNPNYYKKPEKDEELARIISLTHKKQSSFKYSRDKVLSKITKA